MPLLATRLYGRESKLRTLLCSVDLADTKSTDKASFNDPPYWDSRNDLEIRSYRRVWLGRRNPAWRWVNDTLPCGRQLGFLLGFCKEWKEVSPFFMPQTLDQSNTSRKILCRSVVEEIDLLGGDGGGSNPLPTVYEVNHEIFREAFIANLRVLPLQVGRLDHCARVCYSSTGFPSKTFCWRKLIEPIWNTLVRHSLFYIIWTINIEAFELCKHWAFDIPQGDWRNELPFAYVHSTPPPHEYLEGCYWDKVIESHQDPRNEDWQDWRQEGGLVYEDEDWEPYNITAIDLCEACSNLAKINIRIETNDLVVGEMIGSNERFSIMSLERLVDTFGFQTLAALPKLKKLTIFWSWSPTRKCWIGCGRDLWLAFSGTSPWAIEIMGVDQRLEQTRSSAWGIGGSGRGLAYYICTRKKFVDLRSTWINFRQFLNTICWKQLLYSILSWIHRTAFHCNMGRDIVFSSAFI